MKYFMFIIMTPTSEAAIKTDRRTDRQTDGQMDSGKCGRIASAKML